MRSMVEAAFTRGAILGRKYTLGDTMGEGPTGAIFAAEERFRAQRVAIKVARLPASMRVRQFIRDTEAAQAVRSENVIFVYDVGVEGDTPYVVTEWLEGKNLAELAAEYGPFPIGEAVGYVLQACNGLQELHAARVVHRNIKPSNLFLTKAADGGPLLKILDVGLSSTEFALEGAPDGALLDALKFAAPERLAAGPRTAIDARADVWSLAVTLYVLVTGKFPFDGTNATEVREAIARGSFQRLGELVPEAPGELHGVLERALVTATDARTASMADFARALGPFATPPSISIEASPPVDQAAAPPMPAPVEESAPPTEERAPAVVEAVTESEERPPPEERLLSVQAASVQAASVQAASVQADRTAPGATTAVSPPASSARTASSTSRRSLALLAIAAVLLVGFVVRLGRSPAAATAPASSATGEPHLVSEQAVPVGADEPAAPQAQNTTPTSVEETAAAAASGAPTELHDAAASSPAPVSTPRRSRRR